MNLNRPRNPVCPTCKNQFHTEANRDVFCSLACRFMSQVSVGIGDECWVWNGKIDHDGYGHFRWKYGMYLSHRVAWELSNKKLVPTGRCVCHACDNPSCVNPNHLWVGTNVDNITDRHNKGRTRYNPRAGDNGRNAKRNALGQFMCGV